MAWACLKGPGVQAEWTGTPGRAREAQMVGIYGCHRQGSCLCALECREDVAAQTVGQLQRPQNSRTRICSWISNPLLQLKTRVPPRTC